MKKTVLIIILLTVLLIVPYVSSAHGLSVGSGMTLSLGSSVLSLGGDWNNSGTFTAGSGTVVFSGASGNQSIANSSGENFYNITVNKAADDVQLLNDITVTGTLTVTSGDMDLNSHVLTLSGAGTLSESSGNTVKGTSGYITCSRDLDGPSGINPHGIGVSITSASNLGATTLVRGHTAQTGKGNESIFRYFIITPADNSSINATLVFNYDESELNNITESKLIPFESDDGGSTWLPTVESLLDSDANTVTISGLSSLYRYSLASSNNPLGQNTVRVQAKIFLEGDYNPGTHEMDATINANVPLISPYSEDSRLASGIPEAIADWVLVQLRSTADGEAIASKSALLRKDGCIVADDGITEYINLTANAGSYFLIVKHRNHLAVMSDEVHALSESSSTLYNFTVDESVPFDKYFGGEAAQLETGIYGMFLGDTNSSGGVNATDYLTIKNQSGASGYYKEDSNMNGVVNATDYLTVKTNSGKTTQIE